MIGGDTAVAENLIGSNYIVNYLKPGTTTIKEQRLFLTG